MRRTRIYRFTATILLVAFACEIVSPITLAALTSGPISPDFTDFESASTTGMVNEFTGAFTYNLPVLTVPGPHGGSYPISLSYHSGKSVEDEASWVGFGWTLGPGAINRIKRGFPDDYKGEDVVYWNKTVPNWTATVGKKLDIEAFSWEKGNVPGGEIDKHSVAASVGASVFARYNNYKGFSHTLGVALDVKGVGDVGYSVTDGEGSFSYSVNPIGILSSAFLGRPKDKLGVYLNSLTGYYSLHSGSVAGMPTFGEISYATNYPRYTGTMYNFDVAVQGNLANFPVGLEGGFVGSYARQYTNDEGESGKAFGYMYSGQAGENRMDYYVEKDAPYNTRDGFLSIPFSNADYFMVSGEGLAGGFRAYNRNPGHFKPAPVTSEVTMGDLGYDVQLGSDVGGGVDIAQGYHQLSVDKWNVTPNTTHKFASTTDGDEPVFFRFANDMGGFILPSASDAAVQAMPYRSGILTVDCSMPGGTKAIASSSDKISRSGRSSYIGYHTIKEMMENPGAACWGGNGLSYFRAYNKVKSARDFIDSAGISSQIGEFQIVSADGRRYVYGLPVFSRNESSLAYGLDGMQVSNNRIVHKSLTNTTASSVTGEEHPSPYATSYLLTEITTPDYVDRTNDGPTPDDFGGYTKFNYARAAGTNDKKADPYSWYRWRMPYNGLDYQRNSLTDAKDDIGSVVYGEREVYYLSSIETKTHVAQFITDQRLDGFEAPGEGSGVKGDPDATTVGGTNKLRKLSRIELRARDASGNPGKLLTTVRFEYDYSLAQGRPNATEGVLTLRRVYTEYEGAVTARISPYVFGYDYKKDTSYTALASSLKTKYADAINYANAYTGHPEWENPDYSIFNVDRWGYYRYGGRPRDSVVNRWVDQVPDAAFDPAAWQLKWIQLPSGGEIHVQYEQNDYRYVQDRNAMTMVNLRYTRGSSSIQTNPPRYYLSLDSIGIDDQIGTGGQYSAEMIALRDTLRKRFIDHGEKIYFRFLYSLDDVVDPDFRNCASEFIDGYVSVKDVGLDMAGGNGIYFEFHDPEDGYFHPKNICQNFTATSRAGILNTNGTCDPAFSPIQDRDDPKEVVLSLLATFNNRYFDASTCGNKVNLQHSYLRIPTNRDKKGGGIRVKRVLMYDRGIQTGAAALYGSEYIYKTEKGTSSGVATNEPSVGREENALIGYLEKRSPQSFVDKAISGRDKDQFEGPIGESILPAPSIGYSRVVVKNIHTGKTDPGFAVNEYFTARDYPFDMNIVDGSDTTRAVSQTPLEAQGVPLLFYTGFANVRINKQQRTQGFRFVLNQMHGQPKRMASYGGNATDPSQAVIVESTEYAYFQPGEKVLMMNGIGDTVRQSPGKEMEVVFETKSVEDMSIDFTVEVDFSLGLLSVIPFPWGSLFAGGTFSEEAMQTHLTTKVIRYPAIVKGVRTFRDGVYSSAENVAFDPGTGQPILVRTFDGYHQLPLASGSSTAVHKGEYYRYTIPAWKQYPGMGQKAAAERLVITSGNGLSIEKRYFDRHYVNFKFTSLDATRAGMPSFSRGDLVRVFKGSMEYGLFHVGSVTRSQIELLPTYVSQNNTDALVSDVDIEIVHSGRTNQLTSKAGSITTYGVPPSRTEYLLQ